MIYSHLPHPLPIERLLYKHGHMFVSINELTSIFNSYFLFFFPYRAFSLTWPSAMQMFGTKESVHIRKEFKSQRIGLEQNMAAILLFWNTTVAAVTSCENALYDHFRSVSFSNLFVE